MKTYLCSRYRVAWLALAVALGSCSGGGNSLPQSSGPAPIAVAPELQSQYFLPGSLPAITTVPGAINGSDNRFVPRDGDTTAGGHGSTVDKKVPCLPTMPNNYHIHIFLGIIHNGRYVAIPDAIGMVNPGPEVNGFVNSATCFYEIHTHDASGIVHVESSRNIPISSVAYGLKNVLDVWGIPYGKTQFGRWKGPIHMFIGATPLGKTVANSYTEYAGKMQYIPLYSHEVIWIEIGNGYYGASQLPPVTFYTEF